MKIRMTKDSKKVVTLDELAAARKIIEMEKDSISNNEAAKLAGDMLANYFRDGCVIEVFKAEAEIAKNNRVWNLYNDDSGNLDVWVRATVQTFDSFYIFGVYLSDINSITGNETDKEIVKYMHFRRFEEK